MRFCTLMRYFRKSICSAVPHAVRRIDLFMEPIQIAVIAALTTFIAELILFLKKSGIQ